MSESVVPLNKGGMVGIEMVVGRTRELWPLKVGTKAQLWRCTERHYVTAAVRDVSSSSSALSGEKRQSKKGNETKRFPFGKGAYKLIGCDSLVFTPPALSECYTTCLGSA